MVFGFWFALSMFSGLSMPLLPPGTLDNWELTYNTFYIIAFNVYLFKFLFKTKFNISAFYLIMEGRADLVSSGVLKSAFHHYNSSIVKHFSSFCILSCKFNNLQNRFTQKKILILVVLPDVVYYYLHVCIFHFCNIQIIMWHNRFMMQEVFEAIWIYGFNRFYVID